MKKIIFNEVKEVEKLLMHGFTDSKRTYSEVLLVAHHYMDKFQYNKTQAVIALTDFCEKYDYSFNYVIDRNTINSAINWISKNRNPLRNILSINITKEELENISVVKHFQKQKILFTLLVLSKIKSEERTRLFVERDLDAFVIKLSKTNLNRLMYKRFLYDFVSLDLLNIRPRSRMNEYNNLEIMYSFPGGDAALTVENIDDGFIEKYINYYGGEQIYCEVCGKMTPKKGRRHKLCSNCWEERNREQTKFRVRKHFA